MNNEKHCSKCKVWRCSNGFREETYNAMCVLKERNATERNIVKK